MLIKLETKDDAVAIANLQKKGRCINEAGSSFEQKALFSFRRVVKVNPEVANIRVISGSSPEPILLTKSLLSYQDSLPLSERGISKLVVDQQNTERLQRVYQEASGTVTLYEKLLKEGVEIIPIERILEFSKLNYPHVYELITLLNKQPMKYNPDAHYPESTYNNLITYIIKLILPAFLFSQDQTGRLKTVTVTELNMRSSLFLPAKAGKTEHSVSAVAGALFYCKSSSDCKGAFIARLDGDLLAKIEVKAITSSDKIYRFSRNDNEIYNEICMASISLKKHGTLLHEVFVDLDSLFAINSHDSAIKLAVKTDMLLDALTNKARFFKVKESAVNFGGFKESVEKTVTGKDAIEQTGNTDVDSCLFDQNNQERGCIKFSDQTLYSYSEVLHRSIEFNFFLDELSQQAIRNNVALVISDGDRTEQINLVVDDHVKNPDKLIAFSLAQPKVFIVLKDLESLRMFINNIFLNASREMKATYSMTSDFQRYQIRKEKNELRNDQCIPVFGMSHVGKISKLNWNKVEHMYNSITSTPTSEKVDYCECRPVGLPRNNIANASLQAGHAVYLPGATVAEWFTAGFHSGLVSGAIEGGCSYYFGERFWVKLATRASLGYLTGGIAGCSLGITGCGISALSSLMRKKSRRGSLQRGVALLVEHGAIALPVLSHNYVSVIGGEIGHRLSRFAITKSIALSKLAVRIMCRKNDKPAQKIIKATQNKSNASYNRFNRYNKITVQKPYPHMKVPDVVPETAPDECKIDPEEIVIQLNKLLSPEGLNTSEDERLHEIISLMEQLISHNAEEVNKITQEMLSSLHKLIPWAFAKIRIKVIQAYLKKMTDKQCQEDFIVAQLESYEQHKGFWHTIKESEKLEDYGTAVCENPDLYLLYLNHVERAEVPKLDTLFTALNNNNPDKLIKHITKKILENHEAKEAFRKLSILNLQPEQKFMIFQELDHARQLCLVNNNSNRVIGSFYRDYIQCKIQCKTLKKEDTKQKIKAMQHWLNKSGYDPSIGDNLIAYLLPENQPVHEENNERYMDTFEIFKRQLKQQAENDIKDNHRAITKMRARTILLLVQ